MIHNRQRAIAMPTLTFAPSKQPLRVRRRVHGGGPGRTPAAPAEVPLVVPMRPDRWHRPEPRRRPGLLRNVLTARDQRAADSLRREGHEREPARPRRPDARGALPEPGARVEIVGVKQPFDVPLIDLDTGEVLDRALVGTLDLTCPPRIRLRSRGAPARLQPRGLLRSEDQPVDPVRHAPGARWPSRRPRLGGSPRASRDCT
jgi:hypothetical protein